MAEIPGMNPYRGNKFHKKLKKAKRLITAPARKVMIWNAGRFEAKVSKDPAWIRASERFRELLNLPEKQEWTETEARNVHLAGAMHRSLATYENLNPERKTGAEEPREAMMIRVNATKRLLDENELLRQAFPERKKRKK